MDQLPLNAEDDLAARRRKMVNETLDALVDEAHKKAVERGDTITNLPAWRDKVRSNLIAQARENGAGFLRSHHQRLLGGARVTNTRRCSFCGNAVYVAWLEIGDKSFCNIDCAEGRDRSMSYSDWISKCQKDGGYRNEAGDWVPFEQMSMTFRTTTKKRPAAD